MNNPSVTPSKMFWPADQGRNSRLAQESTSRADSEQSIESKADARPISIERTVAKQASYGPPIAC